MREIVMDTNLVAKCGLYCGACPRYLKEKCPGCAKNDKASWCGTRKCTEEHNYTTCADCTLKPLQSCKEFNNFMAKMFGFVFNSDRAACISKIKEVGVESFCQEMTQMKRATIPRR